MDLQKASILLDTINALFKRMEMKGGNVPAIERDLLLENIRELYEFFVMAEANAASVPTRSTPPAPPHPPLTRDTTPPPPPPPAPVREVPKYEAPEPPKPARKVERPADYKPPRIIEIPDSMKDEVPTPSVPTYTPPTPPPPPPPPPAPEPVKVVEPTPPPAPTPTPAKADAPEFDTLFEHKAARELSEKLSERPIADLTRAVGYNDKMLYTNELFGGELVSFNSAVSRINSMGSFAEARKYLAHLAEQNNWTSPKKTGSAKSFIKLVRRRFGA